MATTITNECINCGACEPECPNTAIYAGGVPWDSTAQWVLRSHRTSISSCRRSAPNASAFSTMKRARRYVPSIAASPTRPMWRAKACCSRARPKLHPDETFPDDPPSRFRKQALATGAEAATDGAAVAAVAPTPAPAPAEALKPAPAAAADSAGLAGPAKGRTQASAGRRAPPSPHPAAPKPAAAPNFQLF